MLSSYNDPFVNRAAHVNLCYLVETNRFSLESPSALSIVDASLSMRPRSSTLSPQNHTSTEYQVRACNILFELGRREVVSEAKDLNKLLVAIRIKVGPYARRAVYSSRACHGKKPSSP
jgi:hypothetical protein